MHRILREDLLGQDKLLEAVRQYVLNYIGKLDNAAPDQYMERLPLINLTEDGVGGMNTLKMFHERYGNHLIASSGPRYWGYVVGGATPASLMGDWLASGLDQLPAGENTINIELESLHLVRELFQLPYEFHGHYTSGASMAEFCGLVVGREWVARQYDQNVTNSGLRSIPEIKILSATPHSSIYKAIAMSGMGRENLIHIETFPGQEAINVELLEDTLKDLDRPCIVVANAGTVNTGAFDDIEAIAKLKEKYRFWLHVDAAFGAYAACIESHAHLIKGWENADSIAVDAHKWLNVPYDCGIHFNRHLDLHTLSFGQSNADYLDKHAIRADSLINLTPELSRRIRGVAVWFNLVAYGREGIEDIIQRNCHQAQNLANWLDAHPKFKLLAPADLNIACFTLEQTAGLDVHDFLEQLNSSGKVYMTPTSLRGIPAIRAALCNWRTSDADVDLVINEMDHLVQTMKTLENR